MVSPARRRDAARYLQRRHKVSERRACQVVGQHRSTQRYRRLEPEYELRLVAAMNALAAAHPRWGQGVGALARGGLAGEPQADRAAVAAGGAYSLLEARVVINDWVDEYNTLPPHRGLGMMTPAAFAARCNEGPK